MTVTASTPPQVTRRTPRWVMVTLLLSLLLNGLVIGTLVSGHWALRAVTPWLGSSVNAQLVGFAITLPGERRREIWKATQGERARMRPLRHTIRDAREVARQALLAEPFDAARFEAAQKRLFDAETEARKMAQGLVLAIATRLTPAERAAFARWEADQGRRHRRWWHRLHEQDRRQEQGGLDRPVK